MLSAQSGAVQCPMAFSLRRYIIFFLLMAFVISCCMVLFLNRMTQSAGMALTQEHIEQAAKATFLNVILLSLLCTVIDGIRRRLMVDRPVQKIVDAAEQFMKGDFSVRIPSLHSMDNADGFGIIADYFNQMAEELSGTETLRTDFIANVSHELKNASCRHTELWHHASTARPVDRNPAGIRPGYHRRLPTSCESDYQYLKT